MKLDLDIQELRLIEVGLELRNAHNIKAINGKLNISIHAISSCAEEANKIMQIQEKIKKAYRENIIEKKLNNPKTLKENERMTGLESKIKRIEDLLNQLEYERDLSISLSEEDDAKNIYGRIVGLNVALAILKEEI